MLPGQRGPCPRHWASARSSSWWICIPPGPLPPPRRVLKRLERVWPDLVGVFRASARGNRISPIDKKSAGR